MSVLAWIPFTHPMDIPPGLILWLAIPLCFSVAVIHRTLRVSDLDQLPRRVAILTAEIVLGLGALALVAWLVLGWLV